MGTEQPDAQGKRLKFKRSKERVSFRLPRKTKISSLEEEPAAEIIYNSTTSGAEQQDKLRHDVPAPPELNHSVIIIGDTSPHSSSPVTVVVREEHSQPSLEADHPEAEQHSQPNTDHIPDHTPSTNSSMESGSGFDQSPTHFSSDVRFSLSESLDESHSVSRNAKTAPSTPEAECCVPPRHAESTSQLEMAATLSKRTSIGFSSSKGLESSSENRLHSKEVSPKMSKSRNDKFHKIFKHVPGTEVVLKSYLCAYVGDILLQGYLYISPNFFCFYTKILGHEKQLEIPMTEVINITREKTAFIIPNAIGVLTNKDKYVFGSLMSRDSTYRLMLNVWKKTKLGDDFFDASDTERHDMNGVDSEQISLSSDDGSENSICSECGTPMAEHEPGNGCDNSPTTDTMVDLALCNNNGHTRTDSMKSTNLLKPINCSSGLQQGSGLTSGGKFQNHIVAHNHHHTFQRKSFLPCFGLRSKYKLFSQQAKWLKSLPHSNLLLLACLVLCVFLVLSAAMMSYKILSLQAQLDGSPEGLRLVNSQKVYSDMYYLNDRFHTSTIERFHKVLEANIQLLSEVYSSLHSLRHSSVLSDQEACDTSTDGTRGNS